MLETTIAGYRLVRKLGSGSRADVYLGHPGTESGRPAAIKIFHPNTSAVSVAAEIGAVSIASHAHVVQLRDLSTGHGTHAVLVLERLERGSLAQLLAARGELEAGEAVTVLAPLCAAVEALRDAGVTHSAISASRVLFRDTGAPVLSGFGYASVGGASDIDSLALAALATTVLERVSSAGAVRAWLSSRAALTPSFAAELSRRLFALADATPVRFTADATAVEKVPARALRLEPVVEPFESSPSHAESTMFHRALAVVKTQLDRVPDRFRKPRYLAIAAATVTLLTAMVLVPTVEVPTPTVTPTAAATGHDEGPVLGDDPVAAFVVLAPARNECIRDLSMLCLDSVLQDGSAAMQHDLALIRSIERGEGGVAELRAHNIELVERMGDVALVRFDSAGNGEPAPTGYENVLLVKGEAGWRIRSYLAD